MSSRGRLRAHDAVLGRVTGRAWAALAEHLRADADDRAHYDRASAAMRVLERRAVASVEIDQVERWLEHDGVLAAPAKPARTPRWTWAGLAFAFAAAAVLVLRTAPPPPEEGDTLRAKGGPYARPLGLQLLCDDGTGTSPSLRDAALHGCPQDGTLSFAVRIDDGYTGGAQLSVFGIDARGEVLYYVPVPDHAESPALVHGRWQPLPRAVRLSVNHPVGVVRVFAALTPTVPSIAAIDEVADALASTAVAGPDAPPWHERIAGRSTLLAACTHPGSCASAELELHVVAPGATAAVPSDGDRP